MELSVWHLKVLKIGNIRVLSPFLTYLILYSCAKLENFCNFALEKKKKCLIGMKKGVISSFGFA